MRTPRARGSESPLQPTVEAEQSRRLGSTNDPAMTSRAAHAVPVGLLDPAMDKAMKCCIPTAALFDDSLDEVRCKCHTLCRTVAT